LQRQNKNTKLQKLKESRNTKFCRIGRQNITKKNYRNWTQISNCRKWREDEIPKQLQRQNRNTKLQKLKESRNTRFCRIGRQNITKKNYRNWTQIPNCRNWREEEILKQLQRQNKAKYKGIIYRLNWKYYSTPNK
jgi:uncharacterized CHY-type Zn-finger protein